MEKPDRELLMGLLAVQLGWIESSQLLEAFRSWIDNQDSSLGSHIQKAGVGSEDFALLERLLERHQQTDPHWDRIGDFFSSMSGLREELSTLCLQSGRLQGMKEYFSTVQYTGGGPERLARSPRPTTHIERFRILKPHARGGLGVVYVAEDREFNREVAVKQIRGDGADNQLYRQKFESEALLTGRLEHPGIVPIYALGADQVGRPYYAMRFIQGESLQEACRKFHSSRSDASIGEDEAENSQAIDYATPAFRDLIGRLIDVCNAIDYAHDRGVLHRDLKPGNIMLGSYGETLVVDWGLAKEKKRSDFNGESSTIAAEPSSQGSQTQYGSFQGTAAYAPPEQLLGKLDLFCSATDVYSLGAVLHEVLLGHAPATKSTGKFESVQEIADWIQKQSQTKWLGLSKAPAPLAFICRKALAYDTLNRYPTAKLLRDDLQRWLDDEPIPGHRETGIARSTRWARKHPSLATGGVAGMILVTALLAVASFFSQRLASQRQESLEKERLALRKESELRLETEAKNDDLVRSAASIARSRGNHRESAKQLSLLQKAGKLQPADQILLAKDLWFAQDFQGPTAILNELQRSPQSKEVMAQILLLQGDITSLTGEGNDGLRLVRQAIDSGDLPPSDLAYARGLVAKDALESIAAFDECIRNAPFHLSAASKRALTRLFVGELEVAKSEAIQYSKLFPDDLRFQLLIGMIAAFERDKAALESALGTLQELKAPEADGEILKVTTEFTELLNAVAGKLASSGPFPALEFVKLSTTISSSANSLANRRGEAPSLNLPPEGWMSEIFKKAINTLSLTVLSGGKPSSTQIRTLQELVPDHQITNFALGYSLFSESRFRESYESLIASVRCNRIVDELHRQAIWMAAICWLTDHIVQKTEMDELERTELCKLLLERKVQDGKFLSDPFPPDQAFALLLRLGLEEGASEIATDRLSVVGETERSIWQQRLDDARTWKSQRNETVVNILNQIGAKQQ